MKPIPKTYALGWAGGVVKLSKILEVSHTAISMAPDPLPKRYYYELLVKRPGWFDQEGRMREPPPKEPEPDPAAIVPAN